MRHQRSRVLASACAWVLGMAATHAFAQATPAANEKKTSEIEEVTVTGSFIPTLPEDSAISVQVMNFETLQNLGRPSNLDLVKNLTETGYSIGELNRNNGFPIDAQTINLRSLGPRFTTVVFNNRRFPEQFTPAFGRFNNVQSIPTVAIGSVEILRTGGAAIYGADAVAGVVNYITRKNVTGLELNADYTYIMGSSGDYDLSGLWGTNLTNGNFMIAGGWQHRSRLEQIDRDFSDKQYLENPNTAGVGGWNVIDDPPDFSFQRPCGLTNAQTTYTAAGNTITCLPATSNPVPGSAYTGQRQMGITGTVRDPGCTALGGFAGWSTTPSPVCYGQVRKVESLVEHSDDYSLYSEYNLRFDNNMKFHLEGLLYYRDLPDINVRTRSFPVAYPTGQTAYLVSGLNPAVGYFLNSMFLNPNGGTAFSAAQIAAITNPANPGRATIATGTWSLFTNGGNPLGQDFDLQRNTTTQYRVSTSLSGSLPSFAGTDLEWEVAATFHYVKDTRAVKDILIDRLQAALNGFGGPNCTGTVAGANGCEFLNPFTSSIYKNINTGEINPYYVGTGFYNGYPTGQGLRNDPNMVGWLYVPLHLDRIYKMTVFDPVIRGSTGINLPGGAIKMAVGGQIRYSTEDTNVDDISDVTKNPCPTLGVTTCTNVTGSLAFGRPNGVMGANRDTFRRFPVYAGFLEIDLPVLDNLDIDIAGRYEKFISDYTDKHNDVAVPSISLKYTPVSWLSFRGSYGLTFGQVNPPRYEVPVAVNTTAVAGFTGFSSTANFTSYNYHNLDVEPEKGENISVGFIVQAGSFHATVDYGLISVRDYSRTLALANVVNALVVPGQNNSGALNTILLNCSTPLLTQQFSSMDNRPFVELNGGNNCVQGTTTLQNLVGGRINYTGQTGETNAGKLWSNALDVTASYNFDMGGFGSLTPTLDGTYITKWYFSDFVLFGIPVAKGYDGIGYRNTSAGRLGAGQGSIPHYRATFSLLYHKEKHTVNLQMRYIPSIIDDGIAGIPSLGIPTPPTNPAYNANIGPNTTTNCPATAGTLTSNLGSVPAGAGTGEYGAYCANQNVTVLSGYKIDSFFNLDLIYRFQATEKISINAVISNVFDSDPSFARDQLGYDAGYGSPLGRTYRLGATVKF